MHMHTHTKAYHPVTILNTVISEPKLCTTQGLILSRTSNHAVGGPSRERSQNLKLHNDLNTAKQDKTNGYLNTSYPLEPSVIIESGITSFLIQYPSCCKLLLLSYACSWNMIMSSQVAMVSETLNWETDINYCSIVCIMGVLRYTHTFTCNIHTAFCTVLYTHVT